MQLEENKVFVFKFNTPQGELAIPVRAEDREEAAELLKSTLSSMQTELALNFPLIVGFQKSPGAIVQAPVAEAVAAPEGPNFLDEAIKNLAGQISKLTKGGKTIEESVKKWTGIEMTADNKTLVAAALENYKTELMRNAA